MAQKVMQLLDVNTGHMLGPADLALHVTGIHIE